MQRNKYLEDLGIPLERYGTNFCPDDDPRQKRWKKQREKYGFDSRECYDLDQTFCEWLYSHLKRYVKDASKVTDLEYCEIEFNGETYTILAAIKYINKRLEKYLKSSCNMYDTKSVKDVQDATRMFAVILPYLWW